ncbi:hypothetical protein M434DRAFT_11151 [Hypoxylon sp. CO27-5]|nr:hypothetical protein M434DRAFT_11151 [Hypoxylon sp. CO27-5]
MGLLIDTFVLPSTYNALPLISQVAGAPEDHSQDLQDLRELLNKHNVPKGVSVRLIHKHFDTTEGEVMVFDKIAVPGHGAVQIMKPIVPPTDNQLRGIHYFVDDNACLQAYEYGNFEVPDMSGYESFLVDFCNLVQERGLQRKFGLKLQHDEDADQTGWTEYELHAKRGTIMFPDGMPMPDGDSDYIVTTEWKAILNKFPRYCRHGQCAHCRGHRYRSVEDYGDEAGFYLGGQKILPGTPVYDIVDQIITAF